MQSNSFWKEHGIIDTDYNKPSKAVIDAVFFCLFH